MKFLTAPVVQSDLTVTGALTVNGSLSASTVSTAQVQATDSTRPLLAGVSAGPMMLGAGTESEIDLNAPIIMSYGDYRLGALNGYLARLVTTSTGLSLQNDTAVRITKYLSATLQDLYAGNFYTPGTVYITSTTGPGMVGPPGGPLTIQSGVTRSVNITADADITLSAGNGGSGNVKANNGFQATRTIQVGWVNIPALNNGDTGQIAVTLSPTMVNVPAVVASCSSYRYICGVSSISTSSFRFTYANYTGATGAATVGYWIAVCN